jgi:hypothetical protein
MSFSRWPGFLKRIHGIAQDRVFEQRPERFAIDYVHRFAEQFGKEELEASVFKDSHGALRIEIQQHIEVAIRPSPSAGHRPEDGRVDYSALAQFSFMFMQRL